MSDASPRDPLASIRKPVASEMDAVEALLRTTLETDLPDVAALRDRVAACGGKRLRPLLSLLVGFALGRLGEGHVRLAAALELIHAATLVHDDVIDEARVRRGAPTLNDGRGNEAAVLFGDFVYARAMRLLSDFDDLSVIRDVSRAACQICEGELAQVLRSRDPGLSREDYLRIVRRKTASLYRAAAGIAAHLSVSAAPVRETLETFAEDLGIAFQIVDDCLDLDGDESEVGKSLGTDLLKGKPTLPVLCALERASPADRARLEAWIRDPAGAPSRSEARGLVERAGGIACAREEAERLLSGAVRRLGGIGDRVDVSSLEAFAVLAVRRSR
ncbi:MAG: polyprenyl synthetase family protein [Planctomycetota bacterium]